MEAKAGQCLHPCRADTTNNRPKPYLAGMRVRSGQIPLRDLAAAICILVSFGIIYFVLLADVDDDNNNNDNNNHNRESEEGSNGEAQVTGNPSSVSEPKEYMLSVNLLMDDVLRGPEAYQEKLELMLADTIQKRFLVPPSDEPYNLERGLDPLSHNGQIGQPKIVDGILKGQTNGFFVECGAGNGERLSNSLFFELARNWTGLLVEPNRKLFADLVAKNRRVYAVNACLSIHNYPQEADLIARAEWGYLKEVRKKDAYDEQDKSRVQCFPLFSLLVAMGNPTVDFLSLDVEGAEVEVLQTVPWDRVNIRLILLEVALINISFIDAFLDSKGYDVHTDLGQDKIYMRRAQQEITK